MAWAKSERGAVWDDVRILLGLGHRPGHLEALLGHLGVTSSKVRWRSHKYWDEVNAKKTSHRGPRCPMCRKRRPTFKRDLCHPCYREWARVGRRTGEDHHAWRGGKTFDPGLLRLSSEYRTFRKKILDRDDYQCQVCGVIEDKPEVDHIIPQAARPDLIFNERNVRTLCKRCHKKTATYSNNARYFRWLFKTRKFTDEERMQKFDELFEKGVISSAEHATIRYFLIEAPPADDCQG